MRGLDTHKTNPMQLKLVNEMNQALEEVLTRRGSLKSKGEEAVMIPDDGRDPSAILSKGDCQIARVAHHGRRPRAPKDSDQLSDPQSRNSQRGTNDSRP